MVNVNATFNLKDGYDLNEKGSYNVQFTGDDLNKLSMALVERETMDLEETKVLLGLVTKSDDETEIKEST